VTSSQNREYNNLLQRRQGKMEPDPRVTSRGNLVKFGRIFHEIGLYACVQTDRQTDPTHRQTRSSQYSAPLPAAEQWQRGT